MGKLFILSAPSGTGKTTVAKTLLSSVENVRRVVTVTTREKRPFERENVDYIFISVEEFRKKIERGEFLEYAEVYGNYYGTPKDQIEKNMKEGVDSLLIIDVQGAYRVKKEMPSAVTIFLIPPSIEELKRRMINRGYKDKNMDLRLSTALKEIPCLRFFDYVVINDFLNSAVERIKSIIYAERLKRESFIRDIDKYYLDGKIIDLIKGGDCYVRQTEDRGSNETG